MRKISPSYLPLVLTLSLALVSVARAQSYGPPAGIPSGMPDFSQIPQGGPPAGMGPSEEQMKKYEDMQKQGEAKQKEGEAKGLAQMRSKAIPQFEKAVKLFKNQVEKLNKKGAPTTERMQTELNKLDDFLAKLNAANDIETLSTLFDQFSDLADSAQEALQNMSKGAKWPAVEKQANKLIADLTKQSAALQAKANKKGLGDALTNNFSELNAAIEKQKATLETLKTQVKTDPDTVFDNIGDYFDAFKDIYENSIREINSSLDLKAAVKTQLPKFVSSLENRVKTLAKNKNLDTTELRGLVDEAKSKLDEIKKLTAGKIDDMDTVINAIDELTNIGPQFEDKWQELTGKSQNDYLPKMPAEKNGDFEVKMPAGLNSYLK